MNPIVKQSITDIHNFFVLVSCIPVASPIGIIAISAPSEKNPIPMISREAPAINITMVPMDIGTISVLRISTIAVIGNTDANAS